jgi:hypothetical protein
MSNEIKWPTKPFYIQSKINLSNWALTTDGGTVSLQPLAGSIEHLWTATPDNRGGAILTHVKTGLVLTANLVHFPMFNMWIPGGPMKVASLDPSSAAQMLRAEDLGGNWVGINTLLNWEMKINVYGSDVRGQVGLYHWDRGADNEEWRLIEETGEVTTESVQYDLPHALTDLNLPPAIGASLIEDNKGGSVPLTGSQTLTRSVTRTRSITNSTSDTTGQKYTQTFSAKGGIDKVFEVSASASFEESKSTTISYSDQTTDAKTDTDSQTVNINVPPGKKYSYQIVVHYGKCSINYTAQMVFKSVVPGAAPYRFETHGVYTGVNQIRSEVMVLDITQGVVSAALVQRQALARAVAAS